MTIRNSKGSKVNVITAIALASSILAASRVYGDCPPNSEPSWVEQTPDGERVHCKCVSGYVPTEGGCEAQPAPVPEQSDLEAKLCSARLRVAADQDAIRALNFKSDSEQFEEFAGLAKDAKDEFQRKALDALLGSSLDAAQGEIEAAKSLNPWSVNTRINELQAEQSVKMLQAAGLNLNPLFGYLRQIAAVRGKPQAAAFIKGFLDGIKAEKEAADTSTDITKDQSNARLRVLLGVLKIAQENPELGLVVTGAEFGETLAYGYFLSRSVYQLDALTDDQLNRLNQLSGRLRGDVESLKQAKLDWSNAFPNSGDPSCDH